MRRNKASKQEQGGVANPSTFETSKHDFGPFLTLKISARSKEKE